MLFPHIQLQRYPNWARNVEEREIPAQWLLFMSSWWHLRNFWRLGLPRTSNPASSVLGVMSSSHPTVSLESFPACHDSQSHLPVWPTWQSPSPSHPASGGHHSPSHHSPASPAVSSYAYQLTGNHHGHAYYSPVGPPHSHSASGVCHGCSHNSTEYQSRSRLCRLTCLRSPVIQPHAHSERCGSPADSCLPAMHQIPASSCHLVRHAQFSRSQDLERRAGQWHSLDRSKRPCSSEWMDGHYDGTAPVTTPRSPASGRRMSLKDNWKPTNSLQFDGGQETVHSLGKSHLTGGWHLGGLIRLLWREGFFF